MIIGKISNLGICLTANRLPCAPEGVSAFLSLWWYVFYEDTIMEDQQDKTKTRMGQEGNRWSDCAPMVQRAVQKYENKKNGDSSQRAGNVPSYRLDTTEGYQIIEKMTKSQNFRWCFS